MISSMICSITERNPRAPVPSFFCPLHDEVDRVIVEGELHAVHGQELLVLFHQSILRFQKNLPHGVVGKRVQGGNNRNAPHQLGNEPEFQEVVRLNALQENRVVAIEHLAALRHESDRIDGHPVSDNLLQAVEGAPHDKENVPGIDVYQTLFRMLAPAFRRHTGHSAFKDFKQGLLHAFPRIRRE